MLCYAMLCYAMLCYAMLCYAMLCYAMLCWCVGLVAASVSLQHVACFRRGPAGVRPRTVDGLMLWSPGATLMLCYAMLHTRPKINTLQKGDAASALRT